MRRATPQEIGGVEDFRLSILDQKRIRAGGSPLAANDNNLGQIQLTLVEDVMVALGHLCAYDKIFNRANNFITTSLECLNDVMPLSMQELYGRVDYESVKVLYDDYIAQNSSFKTKTVFEQEQSKGCCIVM